MTWPHRVHWQRRPVALDALQAVQDAAWPGDDDAVDHPLAAGRDMVARHRHGTIPVTVPWQLRGPHAAAPRHSIGCGAA